MEPVEWIIGILLIFGGHELLNKDKPEEPIVAEVAQKQSLVSDEPVFERGLYYRTGEGYFISNLTPVPQMVDGCDRPVLTADLTAPRTDSSKIQVTEIDMVCGG